MNFLSVALLMLAVTGVWLLKVAGAYRQFEYWPENPLADSDHWKSVRQRGPEKTLRSIRRRVVASVSIGPALIMLYLIAYAVWGNPDSLFGTIMLAVPTVLVILQFRSAWIVWRKARQFTNNNPPLVKRTGVAFDKKARPRRIKV